MASRNVTLSTAVVLRRSFWTGFLRDRRGVVGVALAVLLPVLVGFAGIGIEVGLWFAVQRQNQSAADAAALSTALEYAVQYYEQPGLTTDPTAAATTAANCNLFSTSTSSSNAVCPLPSSASSTLTLYPCYRFMVGSSCNTSNSDGIPPNAVQVVLTQPLNAAFANFVTAIWGPNVNQVNVRTTAIAVFPMLPGGQTCLLAVGSRQTLSVGGSATLNLPNCTLASLSILGNSIQLPGAGNPAINAAAIATAGNVQMTDGSSPPPHTFTYFPLQDPYKSVTKYPLSGSLPTAAQCNAGSDVSISGVNPNLSPGCYRSMSFSGEAQVTFNPGLYYIDGGNFSITGLVGATSPMLFTSDPTSIGTKTLYFCNGCTSRVYVGMTVTDITPANSEAIQPGTTVTAVTNTTVLISKPVVNRGVGKKDTIQFAGNAASISGTGVTIVLTAIAPGNSAGAIDIDPGAVCSATVSLNGPTTGNGLLQPSATASQGLLFVQDPTASSPQGNTITTGASDPSCGTSNVTLNGAIYTPASSDNLQGNAFANFAGCTEFIAQSFTFSGNLQLDDTNCSAVGITLNQAQIQQVYLADLVM